VNFTFAGAVSTPRESVAEQSGAQPAAAEGGSSRPPKPKKASGAKRSRVAAAAPPRNPFADAADLPSHECTPGPSAAHVKAEPAEAATPKKARGGAGARQPRSAANRTPSQRSGRWGSGAALGSPIGGTGRRLRSVRARAPWSFMLCTNNHAACLAYS
jgi:hypothetical protein